MVLGLEAESLISPYLPGKGKSEKQRIINQPLLSHSRVHPPFSSFIEIEGRVHQNQHTHRFSLFSSNHSSCSDLIVSVGTLPFNLS